MWRIVKFACKTCNIGSREFFRHMNNIWNLYQEYIVCIIIWTMDTEENYSRILIASSTIGFDGFSSVCPFSSRTPIQSDRRSFWAGLIQSWTASIWWWQLIINVFFYLPVFPFSLRSYILGFDHSRLCIGAKIGIAGSRNILSSFVAEQITACQWS